MVRICHLSSCFTSFTFFNDQTLPFFKLKRNDKKTSKAYGNYHIYLDDEKIESKFASFKVSYRWKDITTHKFKKNAFFLATKDDSLGLWFHKEVLGENYDSLVHYVRKKLSS